MKILICCSKHFYEKIPQIKKELEDFGHSIILPNSFDEPMQEDRIRKMGKEDHSLWKSKMFKDSIKKIEESDAMLVLNFEKKGQKDYIGGATFLEMYDAFKVGKKIFLYNDIPDGILKDEIIGFSPMLINQDLKKVK